MTKHDDFTAVKTAMQLADAKATADSWKKKHKLVVQNALELEKQVEAFSCIQGQPVIHKLKRVTKSKAEGAAIIVPATDWHVEEEVDSKTINGRNSYNLKEAEKRIKTYYSKIPELLDWYQHLAPVAELWHPLLGDLLTGYIHEELMETNALSPTETCVFLQEMICSGLDLLLRETKLPIYVPCCVGNHGRTTAKRRIKTRVSNSYEWLLYKTLQKLYEGNKRVQWQIADGYHNIQTVVGRKVRFHHGDALRYGGGVGGITIPVNKAVAQWDKIEAVDLDVFGHWHQFLSHYPKWVCCGSLMGYNDFALEIKAEYQAPTQAFIAMDRRYGMTVSLPIFVTEPRRK